MKFYLLDDNAERLFEIVNTVCCGLWKKMDDLELEVVLWGDDYRRIPAARDATPKILAK